MTFFKLIRVSENLSGKYDIRILAVVLVVLGIAAGAGTARADSTTLTYVNCAGNVSCMEGSSIYVSGTLNKSSYAPGEAVYLTVSMRSDDYPMSPSGVTPVAKAGINGGTQSADMFPGTYTQQQLRTGISATAYIGVAPASSGTVTTTYSSGGYRVYSGSIPLTVAATAVPAPTASVSISQNPVPYGANPGFTLSSTNAYYCYVQVDNVDLPGSPGYFTSGTFYHGAFTTPGPHTASAGCYNSSWVFSGWSTIGFTVNAPAPLPTASVSVSPNPVPYSGNPGFTLSSTNAYYCYVQVEGTNILAGYATSGTYYYAPFTTPGVHTAYAFCYNSEWVGSGWSATDFTVSPAAACFPSANPPGYGGACASAANACGQTQSNGTIQCNGSCSSTPPPDSNCPSVTASLSANPLSVSYNSPTTLTWTSIGATNCSPLSGNWSNLSPTTGNSLNGSVLSSPLLSATTFTLQCTGPSGTSPVQSVTTTVTAPVCANGANNPLQCDQCPPNLAFVSGACIACSNGGCTSSGGGGGGSASNPVGLPRMLCNNGMANPPACNVPAPTATLSASPSTIDSGQESKLFWTSTHATSCTASGTGAFFITKNAPNNSVGVPTGPLSSTTIYQVYCDGPGGRIFSNTVSVTVLQPTLNISANPLRVPVSGSTTVTWSATDVQSCMVSGPGFPAQSSTGGSKTVTVNEQSTYTLTCQIIGASTSKSVIVNVLPIFQPF